MDGCESGLNDCLQQTKSREGKIIKNWEQALEWYTQLLDSDQFTQDDMETWKATARKHASKYIKI